MWVEIKKDILDGKHSVDELRKLIQDLSYKHKYNILIDIPNIENENVFDNFSETNNENIMNFYNKFINDSPDINYYVSNSIDDVNYFSTTDAITFFNLPLLVLLENNDNDAYFLDAIIREFKNSSKRIRNFKHNMWLKYINSGGSGNIEHTINAEIKNVGGNVKFLKCFVLLDSDLEFPQKPNLKREKLIAFLEELNVQYHILEKREVENYLPTDLFNMIKPNDVFVREYCDKLSPSQKDFIDIEKGFRKSRENLKIEDKQVYTFYININDSAKDIDTKFSNLRYGLNRLFGDFKNEYPILFNDATQDGLIERTMYQETPYELKLILEKITKLL